MIYRFYSKRTFSLFVLALFSTAASSQEMFENLKFEKNTIYIFCRGTTAKSGLIAEQFNLTDKRITHVGIGYLDKKRLRIYNVTDCDTSKTALLIDNLYSFVSSGTYYLSIWKCNNTKREYQKLKQLCSESSKQKVYFDFSFTLNETDTVLYCSEFCSRILRRINSKKFNFEPTERRLESYYQALLNRKKLIYYPVDFFENSNYFNKIFETHLN